MPIDPSISLNIRPPQIQGPMDMFQKTISLKNMLNAQALQQQQFEEGNQQLEQRKLENNQRKRTAEGQQVYSGLLQKNTALDESKGLSVDHDAIEAGLMQAGYPDLAATHNKQRRDVEKASLDKAEKELEVASKRTKELGNLAQSLLNIKDPELRASAWPGALKLAIARQVITPEQAAQLPAEYTKDLDAQLQQMSDHAQNDPFAAHLSRMKESRDAKEAERKDAAAAAGTMVPGTEFITEKQEKAALFQVQQPDGTVKNEMRVLGKQGTAPRVPVPGVDVPLPKDVENQRRRMTDAGKSDNEPLVAVIGPDGKSVLVPRSEAKGKQPANAREQGRAVTSGDAGRIADFDTSLNDLATLKTTIPPGATGTSAKIGAALPNWATDLTGWGTDAKKKQAVIDRVKQVIGKTLEGGVLRKEDELKYEKILPTIADTSEVAQAKLNGLERAIAQRRLTTLDALDDAGYDVSKYHERDGGPKPKPEPKTPAADMISVTTGGKTGKINASQWEAFKKKYPDATNAK